MLKTNLAALLALLVTSIPAMAGTFSIVVGGVPLELIIAGAGMFLMVLAMIVMSFAKITPNFTTVVLAATAIGVTTFANAAITHFTLAAAIVITLFIVFGLIAMIAETNKQVFFRFAWTYLALMMTGVWLIY